MITAKILRLMFDVSFIIKRRPALRLVPRVSQNYEWLKSRLPLALLTQSKPVGKFLPGAKAFIEY
jgi:hypothetical protein